MQIGMPRLRSLAGLIGNIDLNHIRDRNQADIVTFSALRNQFYFDVITEPGVKDPKRAYTRAPEYIRAAANTAFKADENDALEDTPSPEFLRAYEEGKGMYSDDHLQANMDILLV